MFEVTFKGFKTKKQAKAFLDWYEGCGEQQFYDHLDICNLSTEDGCNINVQRKGNTGKYYDINETGYVAEVE